MMPHGSTGAWATMPAPRQEYHADMVAPMSHETEECMRRMAVGSVLGFGVGGSVGALWGGAEIMRSALLRPKIIHPYLNSDSLVPSLLYRVRGAQYNQRVGYVGQYILKMGGGFGFFLAIGSGFWCVRNQNR